MPMRFAAVIALLIEPAALVPLLVGQNAAFGNVFVYECDVLPADGSWTVINELPGAVQFIENGKLVQQVVFLPDEDAPFGEQFDHTRSLAEFDGEPAFFISWRIHVQGNASEIPFVALGAIAAGGVGPIRFT